MSPAEFSSIKWEKDGEMPPQDTWTRVKKLAKVEEQDKASNLLHFVVETQPLQALQSSLIRPIQFADGLAVDRNVSEVFSPDSGVGSKG